MRTLASVHGAILRAVDALIYAGDRQKPTMIVEEIVSRDWASATFAGETHRYALRLEGGAAAVAAAMARLVAEIGETDIPVPGHFVADIGVEPGRPVADRAGGVVQPLVLTALTLVE